MCTKTLPPFTLSIQMSNAALEEVPSREHLGFGSSLTCCGLPELLLVPLPVRVPSLPPHPEVGVALLVAAVAASAASPITVVPAAAVVAPVAHPAAAVVAAAAAATSVA